MAPKDQKDPAARSGATAPRQLGKYELIARIGEGGMAEVYLARQTGPLGFQKVVVVKTIHPHLAREQEFIDMLLDEARVSALIKHPRVVDIYDLGVEDGTYFIAMEYIPGQPLSRVLGVAAKNRKKLDIYSTAHVIADAADGLHAAHNLESISGEHLELVHRDVSPGNIMIMYSGNIKLLDFGVSKSMGRISTTSSGQLKGKLGYASPEQLDEKPLDRRSDVWALGVVLWESLAFRRLYRQTSPAATIKKILEGNTPPPSHHRSEIPSELDDICMKAMSLKPEERFQTAKEMRAAILAFLRSANYYGERERISTFMRLLFADRKREEETLLKKVARAQSEIPVPLPAAEELSEEESAPATPPPGGRKHSAAVPEIEVIVGLDPREDEVIAADDGDPDPAGSKAGPAKAKAKPLQARGKGKPTRKRRPKPALPAEIEVVETGDVDEPDEEDADTTDAEAEPKQADAPAEPEQDEPRVARPAVSLEPEETAEISAPMPRRWMWGAGAAGAALVIVLAAIMLGGGDDDDGEDRQADNTTTPAVAIDAAVPTTGNDIEEPEVDPPVDAAVEERSNHRRRSRPDAAVEVVAIDAALPVEVDAAVAEPPDKPDTAPHMSPAEARRKAKQLYDEGTKAFVSGNLGRAKARFRKSIETAGYAPAYRGMGLIYERQGRKKSAAHYFRKYLRAAPRASDAGAIKRRIERLQAAGK